MIKGGYREEAEMWWNVCSPSITHWKSNRKPGTDGIRISRNAPLGLGRKGAEDLVARGYHARPLLCRVFSNEITVVRHAQEEGEKVKIYYRGLAIIVVDLTIKSLHLEF
ncbi:hypothetical protein PoB_005843100 [Plakobranchus ocellatus]|uniref:Uncharacterized protein n=1 Tax=Plakobranchus ocellatus TaxID=259542 RepID=A0AAV4CGH9_9GAST|nr:hypothetical protein PoB_005843100 [Plakobranchus ocellatus]